MIAVSNEQTKFQYIYIYINSDNSYVNIPIFCKWIKRKITKKEKKLKMKTGGLLNTELDIGTPSRQNVLGPYWLYWTLFSAYVLLPSSAERFNCIFSTK